MKKLPVLVLAALPVLLSLSFEIQAQTVRYVSTTGNDANAGTSWATAYRNVNKAIDAALFGDQVWIAKGTYYPDEGPGRTNNDRSLSFNLKFGVSMYGSFAGTETSISQRNLKSDSTILSGEIQQDGDSTNNSSHVLFLNSVFGLTIDGFVIERGFSVTLGSDVNDGFASGILMYTSTATVSNCSIRRNVAMNCTGCVLSSSTGYFTNCFFYDNHAVGGSYAGYGAGLATINMDGYSCNLINCIFWRNTAKDYGGGVAVSVGTITSQNCVFYNNSAPTGGAFWTIRNAKIQNSVLRNNGNAPVATSVSVNIQYNNCNTDIVPNAYNIFKNSFEKDPAFISPQSGNFRLNECSPNINRGDNTNIIATDADDNQRLVGDLVDIGAFEYQGPNSHSIIYVDAKRNGNGSSWNNAYHNLQDALSYSAQCPAVKQIWVAAGTYYPDEGGPYTQNDRGAAFAGAPLLEIYGGFAGTESSLTERNLSVTANRSILSGEIQQDNNPANNSFSVFRSIVIDSTFVLDGFIIQDGYGNSNLDVNTTKGGGINLVNIGAPTFRNCIIRSNAAYYGAGIAVKNGSPVFIN
jgi:hypothetical protein